MLKNKYTLFLVKSRYFYIKKSLIMCENSVKSITFIGSKEKFRVSLICFHDSEQPNEAASNV